MSVTNPDEEGRKERGKKVRARQVARRVVHHAMALLMVSGDLIEVIRLIDRRL